jgi:hypothetical protein
MNADAPLRMTCEFFGGPLDGQIGVVSGERVFWPDGQEIHLYLLGEAFDNGRATPIMRHERVLSMAAPMPNFEGGAA